jgi:glucose-6-phosphate 1-dehydrogenase
MQKIKSSFIKEAVGQESYERLIEDVILWDKTLFTSWDILEQSWKIVDDIINCNENCPLISEYEKWSKWPIESDKLLERDWRKWYVCDNI